MQPNTQATIQLAEFFEQREVGPNHRKIWVAIRPMTQEQARQAYPYRPHSKYAESRFGGDTFYDDFCLILGGRATRCKMCQAPTKNNGLLDGVCADCDGRSQYNGTNPHFAV